tara:strand:- start:111 stop:221 length:111 start_codon:yes stop_codon:yes gene_type:complete
MSKIEEDFNFKNSVSLNVGIKEFLSWLKIYHKKIQI